MARQREFDPKDVIDRAIPVFARLGYEATSVRDLKEAMGISSSSMYEVFRDKRGVFLAALSSACEQERVQIAQMALDTAAPERFIERLFASLDAVQESPPLRQGSLALNAMAEFGTRDPDVTRLLLEHYLGITGIIAEVLGKAQATGTIKTQIEPLHLAYTILSALQGVAAVKGVKPDFAYVQAVTQTLLKLFNS